MGDVTIVRYNGKNKDSWNTFVSTAKNGIFLFNRNYMDYHSDRFFDHSLMFMDGTEIVALLPANEVDGVLISHGGLTYGGLLTGESIKQHTVDDCFEVLRDYAREQGMEKVIYKPMPHVFHRQPAEDRKSVV